MVRSTVRRAAAFAATGALAVLVGAGPALAADSPSVPGPAAAGVTAMQNTAPQDITAPQNITAQTTAALNTPQTTAPMVPWCHHRGLLSALLEGVGDLLGALL